MAALEAWPPGVVVLDMKMPGMDGLATLKALKERRPDLPVIMLTGHAGVDSAISGLALGAYDYLTKPCDLESLLGRIRAAIAGS